MWETQLVLSHPMNKTVISYVYMVFSWSEKWNMSQYISQSCSYGIATSRPKRSKYKERNPYRPLCIPPKMIRILP